MYRTIFVVFVSLLTLLAIESKAAPIPLPVFESFDLVGPKLDYTFDASGPQEIEGLPGWTYNTTDGGHLEFRSDFTGFDTHPGSKFVAALDNPGSTGINQLIVTVDASGIQAANDQLLLAFNWFDSSDDPNPEDIVSVRGSDSDIWVTVFDFGANSHNGTWRHTRDIDLSAALAAAGQEFSGTMQVRFQQTDDFPLPDDGIAIEDVSIELSAATVDSGSTQPNRLIATMVDYLNIEVPSGGEIEYKVSIINPSDDGDASASSVLFQVPSFGEQTSLVPGSVVTTKGNVIMGNNPDDDEITVIVGLLTDGQSASIYFRATATFSGNPEFFNQGLVSSFNLLPFLTDDARRLSGSTDPTLGRFASIIDGITDFMVSSNNPNVGETLTASATGSGSTQPIIFSSRTPEVCEIQNNTEVVLLGEGSCTLAANQAGDMTTPAAAEVTLSFTVSDTTFFSIPVSKDKKKVVIFGL